VGKSWDGTQPGQLTPADQRDIPYLTMSCSAMESEGKEEDAGTFVVMAFVFPHNHYIKALFSKKWMDVHLPKGSSFCFTSMCGFFFHY